MGILKATPEHMFATFAFDSGVNLHVLWTGQLFTSLVVYDTIVDAKHREIYIISWVEGGRRDLNGALQKTLFRRCVTKGVI